ncbi:MAG: hypothetical protein ACR2M7_05505 [Bdellovibrionales bacterium]
MKHLLLLSLLFATHSGFALSNETHTGFQTVRFPFVLDISESMVEDHETIVDHLTILSKIFIQSSSDEEVSLPNVVQIYFNDYQ